MPNRPMLSSEKRESIVVISRGDSRLERRAASGVASRMLCSLQGLPAQSSATYALYFVAQFLELTFESIAVVALDLDAVTFHRST